MRLGTFAPLILVLSAACGGNQAGPAAASAASGVNPAPPEPAPTASAEAPEPARQRPPFEIHNACADVVTVVFGADPKAPGANRRTIAGGADAQGPRDADGNQTVWLVDDQGEGLLQVNVTRGMKRVEIGRSCRTLDAR